MQGLLCFCRPEATADVVDFAMVELFLSAGSDNYFDKAWTLIWEGGASEGTLMTGVFGLATEFEYGQRLSINIYRLLYWKTVDNYWKITHRQTGFWAACCRPMEQILGQSLPRSSWIVLYFRTPAQPDYWSLETCQFPVSWLFFCSFSHRLKEPSSEGQEWTRLLADSQLPSLASTSSLLMSTLVNHCSRYHCMLYHIAHPRALKVYNL